MSIVAACAIKDQHKNMATLSELEPTSPTESESVNLIRVLRRLQEVLLDSNAEDEARLRNSRVERYKLHNVNTKRIFINFADYL